MYSVFTDFHHASLLQSLILLFEKRLGGKVYRPIGMEWAERGFWKVYDHPATQAQFLGIGAATPDGSEALNEVESEGARIGNDGKRFPVYFCHDIDSGQTNKAITFDGFMSMKIDIVIASIPQHIEPFKRLCAEHPSRPKLIYQIGNQWNGENTALNIMASAKMPRIDGVNFIEYHQEFDIEVFHYEEPRTVKMPVSGEIYHFPKQKISSFVNCFDVADHFKYDFELFQTVERNMNGWTFESHGGQCRNGAVGPARKLADTMREARFIWHTKVGGDGYGHVIHNAAAIGRPLIVRKADYQGKLAETLLIDKVTCIAIDGLAESQIRSEIEYYSEQSRYMAMCKATYENFKKVCNFDAEFEQLKSFLASLQ